MSLSDALFNLDFVQAQEIIDRTNFDVNEVNPDTENVLIFAIEKCPELARQIYRYYSLNNTNNDGYNVLMIAIIENQDDFVHLLLQTNKIDLRHRAKHGETFLQLIVERNRSLFLKQLFKYPNIPWEMTNSCDETLLAWAVDRYHFELVELILPYVDPNVITISGESVFMFACRESPMLARRLLNDERVDINIKDSDGYTPLMQLLESGPVTLALELLKSGRANIESSYLLRSCTGLMRDVAFYLLEIGSFDLEEKDENGMTVLIKAIGTRDTELAIKIIEKGADLCRSDNYNELPIRMAMICDNHRLINYICQHSTEKELRYMLNLKDGSYDNRTVFTSACKLSYSSEALFMLETACADLDAGLLTATNISNRNVRVVKKIYIQRYRERRDFSPYLSSYYPFTVRRLVEQLLTL